jgi:hypothetical protein
VTVTKPQCQLINHFSGFLLGRLFDHPAHPSLPDRQPGLHDGLQTTVGTNFDFRREDQTTGNEKKVKQSFRNNNKQLKVKQLGKNHEVTTPK